MDESVGVLNVYISIKVWPLPAVVARCVLSIWFVHQTVILFHLHIFGNL